MSRCLGDRCLARSARGRDRAVPGASYGLRWPSRHRNAGGCNEEITTFARRECRLKTPCRPRSAAAFAIRSPHAPSSCRNRVRQRSRQRRVGRVRAEHSRDSFHAGNHRRSAGRPRQSRAQPGPDPRRLGRLSGRPRAEARSLGQRHHHQPRRPRHHQPSRRRADPRDCLHAGEPRRDSRRSRRHRPAVGHRRAPPAATHAAHLSGRHALATSRS